MLQDRTAQVFPGVMSARNIGCLLSCTDMKYRDVVCHVYCPRHLSIVDFDSNFVSVAPVP